MPAKFATLCQGAFKVAQVAEWLLWLSVNPTSPPNYGSNPFVDFSPLGAALPTVQPSSPQRPHSTGPPLDASATYPQIERPSAPQFPMDSSGAVRFFPRLIFVVVCIGAPAPAVETGAAVPKVPS